MKDEAFLEKMRAARMEFNPATGEGLTTIVARTIAAPKSVIERYKTTVAGD